MEISQLRIASRPTSWAMWWPASAMATWCTPATTLARRPTWSCSPHLLLTLLHYTILINDYYNYCVGNTHWDWYVETKSNSWGYLLHTWLSPHSDSAHNHHHRRRPSVHVVQYENLINNTKHELKQAIEFLNVTVDDKTLECAVENGRHGNFKRTKHLNFDPFSRKNKAVVNHVLKQVSHILALHGISYRYRN